MNKNQLYQIISGGENETSEFKSGFNNEVIISLSAFVNTKGGTVIIGVSNNRKITGISVNQETIKNWINEIKQKTSPAIIPDSKTVTIDNKNILILTVSEFPVKPVSVRGRYYKRCQSSNQQLTTDEIIEMRFISLNKSFDSFIVNTRISELDKDALKLFAQRIKQSGRYKSSGNIITDLSKLGFTDSGKITRAAELLFGEHHTAIHIGRFKSPENIIDDIVIRSPLISAVDEAMEFIKKNIRLEYQFTGELQRKDRWQYPLHALREILLNSIIHKDYRNPTDIIIKIFDDRIEFSNPGRLIGGLTIDDLKTDNYQAKHRNKLLAEAFYLMNDVEKYGTGFIRIRKHLKDYPELNYELKDLQDFLRFILKKDNNITDKVTNKVTDTLTENQQRIINLMVHNAYITTKELANKIKISQRKIKENIAKLKEKGIIERFGSTKNGHWEVISSDK